MRFVEFSLNKKGINAKHMCFALIPFVCDWYTWN